MEREKKRKERKKGGGRDKGRERGRKGGTILQRQSTGEERADQERFR